MKRLLTAGLTALILSMSVLGLTSAFGDGDPEFADAPQAKIDAVGDRAEVDPSEVTSTGAHEVAPSANVGNALQVLQIKTLVPLLLTADTAAGQLPDLDLADRLSWVSSVVSLPALTNLLKDVWAPSALQAHAAEWLAALQSVADDASYITYDLNTLVVSQWQNVTVDGDTATAVFLGHPRYHTPDGWVDDPDDQYQVTLKHTDNLLGQVAGWRLSDYVRIDSSSLGGGAQ